MATGRLSTLRPSRPRPRLLAAVTLLLVAAGVVVAVTDPFAGNSPAASGASDNGTATSLQTVTRQSLTAQTQVDGTLGYADSSTVSLPAGTAPSSIRQAEQALAAARQALASAQATLAADREARTQAQSQLAADRLKEESDCAGDERRPEHRRRYRQRRQRRRRFPVRVRGPGGGGRRGGADELPARS